MSYERRIRYIKARALIVEGIECRAELTRLQTDEIAVSCSPIQDSGKLPPYFHVEDWMLDGLWIQ